MLSRHPPVHTNRPSTRSESSPLVPIWYDVPKWRSLRKATTNRCPTRGFTACQGRITVRNTSKTSSAAKAGFTPQQAASPPAIHPSIQIDLQYIPKVRPSFPFGTTSQKALLRKATTQIFAHRSVGKLRRTPGDAHYTHPSAEKPPTPKTSNAAKTRFAPQQAACSSRHPPVHRNLPSIHPKVLPSFPFWDDVPKWRSSRQPRTMVAPPNGFTLLAPKSPPPPQPSDPPGLSHSKKIRLQATALVVL
jgi:hypothetical protein